MAEGKPKLLRDCALAINGDDVALRSHQRIYHIWQKITAFGGLEESVGKTYVSRDFVNINSTSYYRLGSPVKIECRYGEITRSRETYLREVPYVNLGLLYGAKRSEAVGRTDQGSPFTNLSARCKALLRYAPEGLKAKCFRRFTEHHSHLLKNSGLPWYIPEWLGGLGLPSGEWGQPSELDLRIAARMLLRWKVERPQKLHGPEKAWKIWKLAGDKLPRPLFTSTPGPATERYERVLHEHCLNILFDARLGLKDLRDRDNKALKHAINHNRKLWRPFHIKSKRGKCELPPPLTMEDIAFVRRYPNFEVEDTVLNRAGKRRQESEDILLD